MQPLRDNLRVLLRENGKLFYLLASLLPLGLRYDRLAMVIGYRRDGVNVCRLCSVAPHSLRRDRVLVGQFSLGPLCHVIILTTCPFCILITPIATDALLLQGIPLADKIIPLATAEIAAPELVVARLTLNWAAMRWADL